MAEQLLFIHGMWVGPWCWDNFVAWFGKRGYDCHAAMLRHHDIDPADPAPAGLGTTSLLDYAADLEGQIGQLGTKPILVGHSMGGLLAQMLASRGLARLLVLLTPAAPAGILSLKPSVVRAFRSTLWRWRFWRKSVRQTFPEAAYSVLHLLPPAEQREAYDRYVYESGRAAAEMGFWLFDPRHASRVDAARVTCPTLVVGGGQDRITPASLVRRVAAKYGEVSTYHEFPEHAHWLLAEPGWEDVAAFVDAWLTRNLTSAS